MSQCHIKLEKQKLQGRGNKSFKSTKKGGGMLLKRGCDTQFILTFITHKNTNTKLCWTKNQVKNFDEVLVSFI